MGNPNRLGPIVTVNKSFTEAILLPASGNQIKKLKKIPLSPSGPASPSHRRQIRRRRPGSTVQGACRRGRAPPSPATRGSGATEPRRRRTRGSGPAPAPREEVGESGGRRCGEREIERKESASRRVRVLRCYIVFLCNLAHMGLVYN